MMQLVIVTLKMTLLLATALLIEILAAQILGIPTSITSAVKLANFWAF